MRNRWLWLLLGVFAVVAGAAVAQQPGSATNLALFSPDNGEWHILHPDGSTNSFFYGTPGDQPLLGDWDCDGEDTVGMFRPANGFVYLRNSNTFGVADIDFFYGIRNDIPLVGDWDGDGCDTLAIYRNGEVFVSNRLGTHPADFSFLFGIPGDRPFTGDFDGDGADTVGLYRETSGLVYFRNDLTSGFADAQFYYGMPSDRIVAGDWDGDGDDSVGIFRPSERRFFLTFENRQGVADLELDFGREHWIAATGPFPPITIPTTTTSTSTTTTLQTTTTTSVPSTTTTTTPATTTTTTLPVQYDVIIEPGDDLQAAVDAQPPGATFLIRSGIHRMQQVVPKNDQLFVGEPGAVMTGGRVLDGWNFDGQWWWVGGQTQQGVERGICEPEIEPSYPRCRHPEDLFVDDVTYRHVASVSDLESGTWYFDYGADRIYLGEDPSGRRVETSVARNAFRGTADGVTIRDLVVEKYAVPAQEGAIDSRTGGGGSHGSNWVVENIEARFNHGTGINVTQGGVIRNSFVHHNGQQGLSAMGANVLIEGNEISHNNTARFWLDWEGGGTKFSTTVDAVVRGNYVHHNYGPGLWADIGGHNITIEDNVVEHNFRSGIMVEITYGATVRNNHSEANGLEDVGRNFWLWSAGILVAASPDVEVYGNTVVGNANGITAVQQSRFYEGVPMIVENLFVHDNEVWMFQGVSGGAQDNGDNAFYASRNNWFENNTYRADPNAYRFAWNGGSHQFPQWNAFGHDDTGSIAAP